MNLSLQFSFIPAVIGALMIALATGNEVRGAQVGAGIIIGGAIWQVADHLLRK